MQRENLHVHYSAEDYDRYARTGVEAYDDGMIRRVLQEQRIMRCAAPKLVDVGTGTAQLLIRMAEDARFKSFELIGTDYFQDMLDTAAEAVAEAGHTDRIRLQQNDVHDLPYEQEFCDMVISRSTIHHWENPVRAFEEIFRVLRKDGVAIIHEPRRDPAPEVLAEFNRKRAELGIENARMDEKYTPGEVQEFLNQAGLQRYAVINAPPKGPSSMGFEVRIARSNRLRVGLFRGISAVRSRFQWF